MSKKYTFVFYGTREDLVDKLKSIPNCYSYCDKRFYFEGFIVEIECDAIRFGIARGGHSGGYWFIPDIEQFEDRLEFCGKIKYTNFDDDKSMFKKIIDLMIDIPLWIIVLIIALIFRIYMFIEWIVSKITKHPKPKEKTIKERLIDLMENYLGCIQK